jgi:hypothetical protein
MGDPSEATIVLIPGPFVFEQPLVAHLHDSRASITGMVGILYLFDEEEYAPHCFVTRARECGDSKEGKTPVEILFNIECLLY